MSNDDLNNPFRNTSSAPGGPPTPTGPMKVGNKVKPPGPFLAICICAIVFAISGITGACCGIIGLGFVGFGAEMMEQAQAQNAELQGNSDLEVAKALMSATSDFMIGNIISLVVSSILSAIMLTAGIMGISGKGASKMMLLIACGGSILYQIGSQTFNFFQQQAIRVAQLQAMAEFDVQPAPGEEGGQIAQRVGGIATGVVVIVLYIVAIAYLVTSKKVPQFFQAKAAQR